MSAGPADPLRGTATGVVGAPWDVPIPLLRAPVAALVVSRAPAGTPAEALLAVVLPLVLPVVGPVLGVALGRSARRRCLAEGLPGAEVARAGEVLGWCLLGVLALGALVVALLVAVPLLWLVAAGR